MCGTKHKHSLGCAAVIGEKCHFSWCGMVCTASSTNVGTCTYALISTKVPCCFQEFTGQGNVRSICDTPDLSWMNSVAGVQVHKICLT